jgi:hypothetical protein
VHEQERTTVLRAAILGGERRAQDQVRAAVAVDVLGTVHTGNLHAAQANVCSMSARDGRSWGAQSV